MTEPVQQPAPAISLSSLITISTLPFENVLPDDLLIRIAGQNKDGLIIEASNHTSHLPMCDGQLCSWLVAQFGFLNIPVVMGSVFHARVSGMDYKRAYQE